jgi:hypothetical protein
MLGLVAALILLDLDVRPRLPEGPLGADVACGA